MKNDDMFILLSDEKKNMDSVSDPGSRFLFMEDFNELRVYSLKHDKERSRIIAEREKLL